MAGRTDRGAPGALASDAPTRSAAPTPADPGQPHGARPAGAAHSRPTPLAGGLLPVGRLRLGWIGWAELTVAALLIALTWRPDDYYLAGAIAVVAIALAVPVRQRSALGWAAVGSKFLLRNRTGVVDAQPLTGRTPTRRRRPATISPTPTRRELVSAPTAAAARPTITQLGVRHLGPAPSGATAVEAADVEPTAALLASVIPGLRISGTYSADGVPIGVVGLRDRWVVVLAVRSDQQLVARVGEADTLPLHAAVPLLDTAGIVLDSVQVVVLNSPGSSGLPEKSAALTSHLELLGGLPTAARRRVLVALRLDPVACPLAIEARGGGSEGAHRALSATAGRAVAAFAEAGFDMRTLDVAETAAAVAGVAGLYRHEVGGQSTWSDQWSSMSVGPLSHRSFAVRRFGGGGGLNPLDQLGNIRARAVSTAVTLSGSPHSPQLTASVRITGSGRAELQTAERALLRTAGLVGLRLTPADGFQHEAFVAGLPLGGPAPR